MTIARFVASPASLPVRPLWLGPLGDGVASVVLVDDLSQPQALRDLQGAGAGLDGVRWVDRTDDFSRLLGHYRSLMSVMLLAGIALVFAALWWRYRRDAWRVMVPTLLAGTLTPAP